MAQLPVRKPMYKVDAVVRGTGEKWDHREFECNAGGTNADGSLYLLIDDRPVAIYAPGNWRSAVWTALQPLVTD